ncbi:hypothetical protein MKI84_12855 [Ancylobacter sp. A5.8]|uniref:Pam3-gp28 family putative phage holin n=1 Tax=Ancylobacter gelatini TaxID=2919920 RepID=UPI001F4EDDEF|nr:hypothetical protein [Ancylobacter gelatini]MCJ8143806.1 hypothetical protein [Ancylobacter gelatini]
MRKLITAIIGTALNVAVPGAGAIIERATATVARRSDVALSPSDVKPVAEAIARQMPAPAALEALWPQNLRIALVALGGAGVGAGWYSQSELEAIVGLCMIVVPWAYRNIETLIARHRAGL